MGHVMHGHGTVALRVEYKGAHHTLDVAQHMGILRVEHLGAIDGKIVHIQVGLQITQGDAPRLIARVPHQRVNAGIDDQAHRVGACRFDLKGHGTILGNLGTTHVGGRITSLGKHGQGCRHHGEPKQEISFHYGQY